MTDLDKLKSILDNQQERGINSGDWERCDDYRVVKCDDVVHVFMDAVKVGFTFDGNGRFKGVYNWAD